MGDPAVLDAFVDFGTAMYPSEHLMVVLWDHGSPLYGVCRDDHYEYPWSFQSCIGYEEVGDALMGHEVDVLAFDSCSGGMAEIACLHGQMNAYDGLEVDYVVASEIYVPSYGYPHDRILLQMNSMPVSSEVVDVATMIAEEYADSYIAGSPGNGGTTASPSVTSPDGMFDSMDAV